MSLENGTANVCWSPLGNETHFCGIFENRPSKFVFIASSLVLTAADLTLLFGAILFERFGSYQKRTLVNRLFTSLCWTSIASLLLGVTDTFRYILGPFPPTICLFQHFLKKIVKDAILVFYNAITVSRYLLIFWIRNPTAVDDDFWSSVLNIWVVSACALSSFVFFFLPGQEVLTHYICCDVNPNNYSSQPQKTEGAILMGSVIIQIVLGVRIGLLKHKEELKKILKFFKLSRWSDGEMSEMVTLEKQTIISGVTIFWTFLFSIAFFGLLLKIRSLNVEQLNVFPNYLFPYCLQLISFQLFGFVMLITFFARQSKMRKALLESLKQRKINF